MNSREKIHKVLEPYKRHFYGFENQVDCYIITLDFFKNDYDILFKCLSDILLYKKTPNSNISYFNIINYRKQPSLKIVLRFDYEEVGCV